MLYDVVEVAARPEFDEVAVDSESGTLVWPGGLDVAPDRLYSEVVRASNEVGASGKA
ncbi:MAG: hypothetical protein WD942_01845 [Dehalococcoidia bacterium]